MKTLPLKDPLKLVREYLCLIAEGKRSEIPNETLGKLVAQLSRDAELNLDRPLENPGRLSGAQARGALADLFSALAGPRGTRRSAEKFQREFEESLGIEPWLLAQRHVDGAPTKSVAEFRAFVAMEILRAKEERDRRVAADRRCEETVRRIFCERMKPHLSYWDREKGDDRERVLFELYKSGLATIGEAGRPTERAIRYRLRLSDSSKRREARLRERIKKGELRLGSASELPELRFETLAAKGLKLLGDNSSL